MTRYIPTSPHLLLSTSLLLACFALPALAASKDDLSQTRWKMDEAKERQAELGEQSEKAQGELMELQKELVEAARAVQQSEVEMHGAEEKLHILNEQLDTKNDEVKKHRKTLAALVLAALRLSRTPPEAVVMMPGDAEDSMRAARTLKTASDSIHAETETIGVQLAELQKLKVKVEKNRDEIARKQAALSEERAALAHKVADRKALVARLGRQQQEEEEKLAALAKKAEDLQGLFSALENRPVEPAPARTGQRPIRGHLRSFAEAMGHIRPPAAGQVVEGFGSMSGSGDTSKGIVIATERGAQVTAPYDGEVEFAGPFRGYGRLVILRHSDDFHTLLAGLAAIDAEPGQFLLEGEPIGAMGNGDAGNRLYVELRKNSQPVDPGPWISGMNRRH